VNSLQGKVTQHYAALDSLRGICALAVVLFHFRTSGNISNLGFVRHSWMFVDFFFVLSGFVISAAYAAKFLEGRASIPAFMGLRMGRIYPLHLAVLIAMLALEGLLLVADFSGVTSREPFTGSRSVAAILSNLGLVHVFGVHDLLTWNAPSWSIAAEMWMYLLFAIVFCFAGKSAWATMVALGVGALIWLMAASPAALNTTYELGFIRCVYGFSIGTIVFWATNRGWGKGGTGLELAAALAVILFVSLVGKGSLTFLAPLLFAFPVFVFAQEQGALSKFLTKRVFLWLGTISYSTYMIHGFVQARMGDVIKVFGAPLGLTLAPKSGNAEFPSETIAGHPLMLDLLTIIMLLLVVAGSSLTYRWIEAPCREWSRRLVKRMEAGNSAPKSA
jgi:peptidoglycan/LPS O-acetylase OafA/YrhL